MRLSLYTILAIIFLGATLSAFAQTSCLNIDVDRVAGAAVGDNVCVDIRARNFGDIIGMQYTHVYDANELEYTSVQNGVLGVSSTNFGNNQPGVLTFNWIEPNLDTVDMADDAVLYSVCFLVKDAAATVRRLAIFNTPTSVEFVRYNDQIIENYGLIDGGIQLGTATAEPAFSSACVTPYACGSGSQGAIAIEVLGTSPFAYVWSGPGITGVTTQDLDNLTAGGVYQVTVTDAVGQTREARFWLEDQSASAGLTLTASITAPTCSDANSGAIDLTVQGGTPASYAWSIGATTEDISGLTAGAYTVTVTLPNGCSTSQTFTVASEDLVVNGMVNPIGCVSGVGSVTLLNPADEAGMTYLWNTGATTRDLTDVLPGTYTVTVTTAAGCEGASSFVLEAEELLAAWTYECIQSPPDTTVSLSTLLWNPTAFPVYHTYSNGIVDTLHDFGGSTIIVPANESYSVTITDAGGCSVVIEDMSPYCPASTDEVVLWTETQDSQLAVGDPVCVSVRAANFTNIAGAQLSLQYDPAILDYTGVQNFMLEGNSDIYINQTPEDALDGIIRLVWTSNDVVNGQTFTSGERLFDVCFMASAAGQSDVAIVNAPIPIEVVDVNATILPYHISETATVQVGTPPSVTLRASHETTGGSTEACVKIFADNFSNVNGVQGTIAWDPTVVEFSSTTLYNLPNMSTTNFGLTLVANGQLPFTWFDPELDGHTISSDIPLFAVCFTALVTEGVSPINFTNQPVSIEIVDVNDFALDVFTESGSVAVTDQLVWPGDTDANDVVNHFDLLNIGLAFDQTGPARINATTDWVGQYAPEWGASTPVSEIDFQHADADGSGIVSEADVAAIELNWDETTDFWSPLTGEQRNLPVVANPVNASLYVEATFLEQNVSTPLKIILGEADQQAEDVYGLAFSIYYDPAIELAEDITMDFATSWLGTIDDNLLAVYRMYPDDYRVDVALTRTDGTSLSGAGQIGTMYITIEDVIFRHTEYELDFTIGNVLVINNLEEEIPVQTPTTSSEIIIVNSTSEPAALRQIHIYPVPVLDQLTITTGQLSVERIELYHVSGKYLRDHAPATELTVSDLTAGSYVLRIHTEAGVAVRRFVKQ